MLTLTIIVWWKLLKKDKQTKAIMNIHILGNSPNMDKLTNFTKSTICFDWRYMWGPGSKFKSKHLGTFGDFGTYSFYYSHQITSGEGGMVVCKTKEDYDYYIPWEHMVGTGVWIN